MKYKHLEIHQVYYNNYIKDIFTIGKVYRIVF